MRVNTLLVRYRDGYMEVSEFGLLSTSGNTLLGTDGEPLLSTAQTGRIEGFVNYPEDTQAEAIRKAQAKIDELKTARWQSRVGVEPTPGGGDMPFTDWDLFDTITIPDQDKSPALSQVVGLSVSEDEAGNPIYAPRVGQILEDLDERNATVNRRMSRGTLGGRDKQSMPVTGGGRGRASALPVIPTGVGGEMEMFCVSSTATVSANTTDSALDFDGFSPSSEPDNFYTSGITGVSSSGTFTSLTVPAGIWLIGFASGQINASGTPTEDSLRLGMDLDTFPWVSESGVFERIDYRAFDENDIGYSDATRIRYISGATAGTAATIDTFAVNGFDVSITFDPLWWWGVRLSPAIWEEAPGS